MTNPQSDWNAHLAREYASACIAVMDAANAALGPANEAVGARNMAAVRPQHEISIQTFTQLAGAKEAEFSRLYQAFESTVAAARAAGVKLAAQFRDLSAAEDCLLFNIDLEIYSQVGAAIEFLRVTMPSDPRGFQGMIPQINHAINNTPGYGQPGFQGSIYTDGHTPGVNYI
ncbi:MAG TPA: hypothetical protein VMU95_32580 [Trebonia sp.]|nr:hypothetical protein [Trebonia sp.]